MLHFLTSAAGAAALPRLAVIGGTRDGLLPKESLDTLQTLLADSHTVEVIKSDAALRGAEAQLPQLELVAPDHDQQIIRLGKRLNADALLIIEPLLVPQSAAGFYPNIGGHPEPVATGSLVRLVETRQGVELDELEFPLLTQVDANTVPSIISAAVIKRLSRISKGVLSNKLIAVSDVRIVAADPNEPQILTCALLSASTSQCLKTLPGIAVAPFASDAIPVMDRTPLARVSKAAQATAITLTGEIKQDPNRVQDPLEVTIRASSAAGLLFEAKVRGDRDRLLKFASDLAGAITEGLKIAPAKTIAAAIVASDLPAETKALQEDAERAVVAHDDARAIADLEAASVLSINRVEPLMTLYPLLDRLASLLGGNMVTDAMRERYTREGIPVLRALVDLAGRLVKPEMVAQMRRYDGDPLKWRYSSGFMAQILSPAFRSCLSIIGPLGENPTTLKAVHSLRPRLAELYADWRKASGFGRKYVPGIDEFVIEYGVWWCETPEEYIAEAKDAMEVGGRGHARILFQFWQWSPYWKNRADLPDVFEKFLTELTTAALPKTRATAEIGLAQFYGRDAHPPKTDKVKARQHYERFLAALVDYVKQSNDDRDNTVRDWVSGAFSEREVFGLDAATTGHGLHLLVQEMFERGPSTNGSEWAAVVKLAQSLLELGSKPQERDELLREAITAERKLQEAYSKKQGTFDAAQVAARAAGEFEVALSGPGHQPAPGNTLNATTLKIEKRIGQKVFSIDSGAALMDAAGFPKDGRRVLSVMKTSAGWAVVCRGMLAAKPDALPWSNERLGVLRLGARDYEPVSFAIYDSALPIVASNGDMIPRYAKLGPRACVDGDTVLIGHPADGILYFPKAGPVKRWTEKTGLVSTQIQSIDAMNGKLYTVVGDFASPLGLMETDELTGKSRLVLKPKQGDVGSLGSRLIMGLAADPVHRRLWLTSPMEVGLGIYTFDPATAQNKKADGRQELVEFSCVPGSGTANVATSSALGIIDFNASVLRWWGLPPLGPLPMQASSHVVSGKDLIVVAGTSGGEPRQFYRVTRDGTKPSVLTIDTLAASQTQQLIPTTNGFLGVTDREIIAVALESNAPAHPDDVSVTRPRRNEPVAKLAVIGASRTGLMSAGLLDLLQAECADMPGVTLVERTEIQKVISEQVLSKALGDSDADDKAAHLGQLASADIILLVEPLLRADRNTPKGVQPPPRGSEPKSQDPDAALASAFGNGLRARMLDTRYGLKLWDSSYPVDPATKADQLMRGIGADAVRRLRRLGPSPSIGKSTIVGVIGFVGVDPSHRFDWLAEILAAGTEHRLLGMSGVILAERERTSDLTNERLLTPNLPAAIKSSAVLIDGHFLLDRDQGPGDLSVTVRGRIAGNVVFEKTARGTIADSAKLTSNIATAIEAGLRETSQIKVKPELRSMDGEDEAALLAAESQRFQRVHDDARAVAALETAVALSPVRIEHKIALIQAVNGYAYGFGNQPAAAAPAADVPVRFLRNVIPYYHRAIGIAEQLLTPESLAQADQSGYGNLYGPQSPGALRLAVQSVFTFPAIAHRKMGTAKDWPDVCRDLRPELRSLYEHTRQATASSKVVVLPTLESLAIGEGIWWCDTPEQYYTLARESLDRLTLGTCNIRYENVSKPPGWASRADFKTDYIKFLNDACASEKPKVKAVCEEALAVYFGYEAKPAPDKAKSRQHLLLFIDALVEYIKKTDEDMSQSGPSWVMGIALAPDHGGLDSYLAGKSVKRVLEAVLLRHLPRPRAEFSQAAVAAVQLLDNGQARDEADELLQKCIAEARRMEAAPDIAFDHTSAAASRQDFEGRLNRPNPAGGAKPPAVVAKAGGTHVCSLSDDAVAAMLNTAGFPKEGRQITRLVRTASYWAVVCRAWTHADAAGGDWRAERLAVVWLNARTFVPTTVRVYSKAFGAEPTGQPDLRGYLARGPEVCVLNNTVYLASPWAGILGFAPNVTAVTHFDETGGLASGRVTQIDAMNGKLYALCGDLTDAIGLMEVDVLTGKGKLLINYKLGGEEPLASARSAGLVADPEHQRLWLTTTSPKEPGPGLYRYDPKTGKGSRVSDHVQLHVERVVADAGLESVNVFDELVLGILDLHSGAMRWYGQVPINGAPPARDVESLQIHAVAYAAIHEDLYFVGVPAGQPPEVFCVKGGKLPAVSVYQDRQLNEVRQLVATPEGLLLVRADEVRRIPAARVAR